MAAKKKDKVEDYLESRIKLMSELNQQICRERIAQARKLGWTRIDIWDEGETPSPWDLVGITPKDYLDFLPAVDSEQADMSRNE